MRIAGIDALQIFDSRGTPTVEAVVVTETGAVGHGLVPAGASTGRHEAVERRDGDPMRFRGRSVEQALQHIVREIAPALAGREVFDQAGIDHALIELDGTPGKARLGANAILAVSLAVANAAAAARGIPLFLSLGRGEGALLPWPEIQIFGGGRHADGRIDVQDFMVVALRAESYAACLEVASGVYQAAGDLLRASGRLAGVADEGGYWPAFSRNEEALELLVAAIERAGYRPGRDVGIALDIAATELCRGGDYVLGLERRRFPAAEFGALLREWLDRYPIVSLEDPFAEDDWEAWRQFRAEVGGRCQLVGDDLFTTNLDRIGQGVALRAANAVLIKPNQIGTVTETVEAIRRTQAAGWLPIVSARSGETEDTFIAHLAVATNAGQLKVGSFARGERMAKWNEVLRIGRLLGGKSRFAGAGLLRDAGIDLARFS